MRCVRCMRGVQGACEVRVVPGVGAAGVATLGGPGLIGETSLSAEMYSMGSGFGRPIKSPVRYSLLRKSRNDLSIHQAF